MENVTILQFKLSRLSYTAVEYFSFSIVISISKYDSWVPHCVVFFSWSSLGYMSAITE